MPEVPSSCRPYGDGDVTGENARLTRNTRSRRAARLPRSARGNDAMQTVPACWLKLRVGDDLMCPLLCPLWIESGVTQYKSWFSRIGAKCLILLTQYDTVRNQLNGLVPAVNRRVAGTSPA